MEEATYENLWTDHCARLSAGAVIKCVDLMQNGEFTRSFCNIWPPGHHATSSKADGYCYFNNVAIGARHYLNLNPGKRVLIIDWDVHVGDGTYSIFLEDQNVLTISTHRYDNGTYWPFGTKGHYS